MPKLYYKYGTMNSSKTSNLLMIAHNYTSQGKKVCLIKPQMDSRFSVNQITSRAIGSVDADILLCPTTDNICTDSSVSCVLVDEAQFLSEKNVLALRNITEHTPVMAFGLRTDFMGKLFEGSRALFELADSIEEIKTICEYCERKAIINAKYTIIGDKQKIIYEGNQIELGSEDIYKPMCWKCWKNARE